MSQREPKSDTPNGSSAQAMEASKVAALQQYLDTEGHFSLVRFVCPTARLRTTFDRHAGP